MAREDGGSRGGQEGASTRSARTGNGRDERPSTAPDPVPGGAEKKRRYVRFTRWRRRRFFAVLEETGNAEMAAEAAGVSQSCIYRLRRVEAGFTERMAAAVAAADARLARQEGTVAGHCAHTEDGLVIRRGIGGRLRVMAAGTRWWTGRHDAVFLGHVRATGNVTASARAAGFTPKSAWNRRRRVASFARALDGALDEAEIRLEWRVIEEASKGTPALYPGAFEAEPPGRFDPWLGMHFLTYRENKRQGRHKPARRARRPTIEAVTEKIVRKVRAIKRHRARFGEVSR